jgi:phage I-like protein
MRNFINCENADAVVEVQIQIANSSEAGTFSVNADDMFIPFGDYPHPNGLQRLSKEHAVKMLENFRAQKDKLKNAFGGAPVYKGHPDVPGREKEFSDQAAYAWIEDIRVDNDGVHLLPKWSKAGLEMLENGLFKFFSPYWGGLKVGTENGKPLLAPVFLYSVGLTNRPNLPVNALVNEKTNNEGDKMMREMLIKALGLPDTATDEDIQKALQALLDAKKTADDAAAAALNEKKSVEDASATLKTENETLKTEKQGLETNLANEKSAKVKLALDNAIKSGKITAAERAKWEIDLANDFQGKLVELENKTAVLAVESKTKNLGARNSQETSRIDQVVGLVNERMTKTKEPYEMAFANVKKENPQLFAEMKQSAVKK